MAEKKVKNPKSKGSTNEEMEALKTIQFNTYDMNVWVELYSKFVLSELPTMKEYLKKLREETNE